MVRTQIYLTEDERSALKQLAEERDTSQSALIRTAVDQYLEAHSHEQRLSNLRAVRGLWGDRENLHEIFRRRRESWDRDVPPRENSFR